MTITTSNNIPDNINELFEKIDSIVTDEMIRTLAYIGEQCVIRIRDRSAEESWHDITGNLRSSIGYLILHDGNKIVDFGFSPQFGKPERKQKVEFTSKDGKQVSFMATVPGGGSEGASQGKRYAQSLISAYSHGLVLLVVAGMEYAEYVERMGNKDVLASTELWVRDTIDEKLQKTKARAEQRIIQEIENTLK